MGRKRRLPARAREKLVAEEAASAMEVERKEAVLQGKPDDSLFVLDSAGVCVCVCVSVCTRRKYKLELSRGLSCPPHLYFADVAAVYSAVVFGLVGVSLVSACSFSLKLVSASWGLAAVDSSRSSGERCSSAQ